MGTFCLLLTQLKWSEIGAIAAAAVLAARRRLAGRADWVAVNVLIRRHCFRVMSVRRRSVDVIIIITGSTVRSSDS